MSGYKDSACTVSYNVLSNQSDCFCKKTFQAPKTTDFEIYVFTQVSWEATMEVVLQNVREVYNSKTGRTQDS